MLTNIERLRYLIVVIETPLEKIDCVRFLNQVFITEKKKRFFRLFIHLSIRT